MSRPTNQTLTRCNSTDLVVVVLLVEVVCVGQEVSDVPGRASVLATLSFRPLYLSIHPSIPLSVSLSVPPPPCSLLLSLSLPLSLSLSPTVSIPPPFHLSESHFEPSLFHTFSLSPPLSPSPLVQKTIHSIQDSRTFELSHTHRDLVRHLQHETPSVSDSGRGSVQIVCI